MFTNVPDFTIAISKDIEELLFAQEVFDILTKYCNDITL